MAPESGNRVRTDLFDFALRELQGKFAMGNVILGNDDKPAGLFVQAVHNARAQLASNLRQMVEVMQQRIDQRSAIALILGGAPAPGRLPDR